VPLVKPISGSRISPAQAPPGDIMGVVLGSERYMYNHHEVPIFPPTNMRFQPFSPHAVAAAILVSALALHAQSAGIKKMEAGTAITSLTNLKTHRRPAVPFGAIDAGTNAPVQVDVTVQPDPTSTEIANQFQTGGGAGGSGFRGSAFRGPIPAVPRLPTVPQGQTVANIPPGIQIPTGEAAPTWSSGTNPSVMPASPASARNSYVQTRAMRQSSSYPSFRVPSTPSVPPASPSSSSMSRSVGESQLSWSARRHSTPMGTKPADRARGYLSWDSESAPGLIGGGRVVSGDQYRNRRHLGSNESGGAADLPGPTATTSAIDESTSASADSSSLSGQAGQASHSAPQGFFEVVKDPFGDMFENGYENFSGALALSKTCGEACKLTRTGPSHVSTTFAENDSEEADQDNPESGLKPARSRRAGTALSRSHGAVLRGESSKHRGLLETEPRIGK